MAKLSNAVFQKVLEGRLDQSQAGAIGRSVANNEFQAGLADKVIANRWDASETEIAGRKMAAAGEITKKFDGGLFGDFEETHSTFDQEVELEKHAMTELGAEARAFATVSSKKLEGRVGEAGNVLNIDENQKRKQVAESLVEDFDRERKLAGPVSEFVFLF